MIEIYLWPVFFYKKYISPLLPQVCRYNPTCSEYFVLVVRKKGIIRGTFLGVYRLLRCNPFYGGPDPLIGEEHECKHQQ